jgi:hypothetical protein
VGDHGIVDRVGVFGDIEIFLHHAPRIGEERPVGADAAAIFIRRRDVVGANCDEPAIGYLKLAMKLHEAFRLAAILRTESAGAEDDKHVALANRRASGASRRGRKARSREKRLLEQCQIACELLNSGP